MRDDQLFGLIAMLALLSWLGASLLPPAQRRLFERLAFALLGGGILVAIALTIGHFVS